MKKILYIIFLIIIFACSSESERAEIITEHFISRKEVQLGELYKNYMISLWNAKHNNTEDYIQLSEQSESIGLSVKSGKDSIVASEFYELKLHDFYLNDKDFKFINKMRNSNLIKDEKLARKLDLLYFAYLEEYVTTNDSLFDVTEIRDSIKLAYKNHIKKLNKEGFTRDVIDSLNKHSSNLDTLKYIWMEKNAYAKNIYKDILKIVKNQNMTAQSLGYRNYYELCLLQNEIDPEYLEKTSKKLASATAPIFKEYKNLIDNQLKNRFIGVQELNFPWHYNAKKLFFEMPENLFVNYDSLMQDVVISHIVQSYYDTIGADLSDVFKNSVFDSSYTYGAYSYMMYIDFKKDVRVSASYSNKLFDLSTVVHSFGHAVYATNIDEDLPFLFRIPNLPFNEGVAYYFTNNVFESSFQNTYLFKGDEIIEDPPFELLKDIRIMILMRSLLFKDEFARKTYEDPDQDLNALYRQLLEKYLYLKLPENEIPYWGTEISLIKGGCRHASYIYALLIEAHLTHWLKDIHYDYQKVIMSPELLKELKPLLEAGNSLHFNDIMENVTGEPLNYEYFIMENSTETSFMRTND